MKKVKTIYDERYKLLIYELSKERIRLKVSQSELASQIGLNQSDICKIEKFEKRLDILEFSMILEALRISENMTLQRIVRKFIGLSE